MKKAKAISPVSPNFVTASTPVSDIEWLIMPVTNERVEILADNANMEDVVVAANKFTSKSQARKNGWTGPIPEGFNVWQIGKDQFVTLNMKDDLNE